MFYLRNILCLATENPSTARTSAIATLSIEISTTIVSSSITYSITAPLLRSDTEPKRVSNKPDIIISHGPRQESDVGVLPTQRWVLTS